ncbi:MAG: heme o synthase [Phycisphaerae bacterium]|nr:heme o synthase [Phycisphaerae bacterium]
MTPPLDMSITAPLSASRAAASPIRNRVADFLQLSKFRLSLLVLAMTAVGYGLAAGSSATAAGLFHVIFGTALVAFAANAGNQVMERRHDARMVRTSGRPIPAGRVTPLGGVVFSVLTGAGGFAYLLLVVNSLAALLALSTLVLYLVVYTPLKRVTSLNTLVGAVPGAIPPMIGVAAAAGALTVDAWLLFAILFVWQIPHFFSIAWLYREDYARGGYRMLSVVDPSGRSISRQTILFTIALLLVSLTPAFVGRAGMAYLFGAGTLGYGLLICAIRFACSRDRRSARSMLLASIAYLPLLAGLFMAGRWLV